MNGTVRENIKTKAVFTILPTPTIISAVLLTISIALSYFISKSSPQHISIGFPSIFYKTTNTV